MSDRCPLGYLLLFLKVLHAVRSLAVGFHRLHTTALTFAITESDYKFIYEELALFKLQIDRTFCFQSSLPIMLNK